MNIEASETLCSAIEKKKKSMNIEEYEKNWIKLTNGHMLNE